MRPSSELYLAHGIPERIFPEGRHVFAADLGALSELVAALAYDFAAVHVVSPAELEVEGERRPLGLPRLRSFLDAHRGALEQHWDTARIRHNSAEQARRRLQALRAMAGPELVLLQASRVLDSVLSDDWRPALDIELLVPDVLGAASLGAAGGPSLIEADVSSVVLLAALACTDADALSRPVPEALEWRQLIEQRPLPLISEPRIGVRAALGESVKRLELSSVPSSVAARGALLLVET